MSDKHNQRLRILMVADSMDVGGAERHVVGLATALLAAGHHAEIVCSVEGGLASAARQAGIVVRPLGNQLVKRRVSPSFARGIARLLDEARFDLVHAHMYASAAAAALAALGRGVPLVVTEHSEAGWRGPKARLCARFIYARAGRIIAVSDGIRRRLMEQDHVPAGHIAVIRNALPPVAAADSGSDRISPLALDGRGGPRVGVVARLQPEKGLAYFVRAAERVTRSVPDVSFLIVGDGPQRAELAALSTQLGLGERLRVLGFHPDAPSIIRSLDVLVVPSLSEGTPLVVLEGMAAGVPIVATAVGGIPEQICHEHDGLLVPPADAPALAEAIVDLLRHPDRARRLGEAGRERTIRYTHATMLEQSMAVYSAVLRQRVRTAHAASLTGGRAHTSL